MVDSLHEINAAKAKQVYLQTLNAKAEADNWHKALRSARTLVADALRDSSYLSDIAGALKRNGGHMLVYRHLMAPPKSQDQFKLRCPSWSKGTENKSRPVSPDVAEEAAIIFDQWRDPALGHWLKKGRKPTRAELRQLLIRATALIAHKNVETQQRTSLSNTQESSVVELLKTKGWKQIQSSAPRRLKWN